MKMSYLRLATVIPAILYLQSCTLDPYIVTAEEEYTRNFIKQFGLIDEKHDWNMAQSADVTLSLGDRSRSSVKVYARYETDYYLVADLSNVKGTLKVPVDVPKSTEDLLVRVNHSVDYTGKLGQVIDCTGSGKPASRASKVDEDARQYVYDPYDPAFDFSTTMTQYGGAQFGIQVSTPNSSNHGADKLYETYSDGYIYYNAQQMGPIIDKNEWADYVSLSAKGVITNDNEYIGILPEIGVNNKTDGNTRNLTKTYGPDQAMHLEASQKKANLKQDFTYKTINGEFDIFPMFYGSNQVHILGVYFIDPNTGEPLYGADNDGDGHPDLIKFPIFETKHNDDIMIKMAEDGNETDIAYYRIGTTYFTPPLDAQGNYYSYDVMIKLYEGVTSVKLPIEAVLKNGSVVKSPQICDKLQIVDTYWPEVADIYLDESDGYFYVKSKKTTTAYWPKIKVSGTDLGISLKIVIDDGRYFTFEDPTQQGRILRARPEDDNKLDYTSNNIELAVGEEIKIYPKFYNIDGKEIATADIFNEVELETYKDGICDLTIDSDNHCIVVKSKKAIGNEVYCPKIKLGAQRIGLRIADPGYKSSAPRRVKSRDGESGAPQLDYNEATKKDGILYHDGSTKWQAINKIFINGTADSYPVDQPRLVRSRGYHVKLTYKGEPWTGAFGMYIDYKWNPEENPDGSITCGERPISGSHYSQMRLNSTSRPWVTNYKYYGNNTSRADSYKAEWEKNGIPADAEFQYSYAATFTHPAQPASNQQFFCFEDWPISHPGPSDRSVDGKYYNWDYGDNFKWEDQSGTYSSDRDNNDLIFMMVGEFEVDGTYDITEEKKETFHDEGFSWYWAVEDLGATDDFDFNDLVVKITSITKMTRTVTTTTTETENGNTTVTEGTQTITIPVKKVVFQPLAAGGTLPLYINWKDTKGNVYSLKPGIYYQDGYKPSDELSKYDEDYAKAVSLSQLAGTTTGMTINGWFGVNNDSKIVNTYSSGAPGKTCTIYMTDEFTIAEFGGSKNMAVQGEQCGLSVFVDDERENQTGEITQGWTVSRPDKGKISQMFMIYSPGYEWKWPEERIAINSCYPKFNDWIQDRNTIWFRASDAASNAKLIGPGK